MLFTSLSRIFPFHRTLWHWSSEHLIAGRENGGHVSVCTTISFVRNVGGLALVQWCGLRKKLWILLKMNLQWFVKLLSYWSNLNFIHLTL